MVITTCILKEIIRFIGAQPTLLITFCGLFFQDQSMVDTFKAYPEMLFVDATYKLLDLGIPVFLFLCKDSNGNSEIVSVCLLVNEDLESLKWMIETFKQNNSKWVDIRIVMSDKDIKEREVFANCLPNARLLICLFHTLRSFRREISSDRLGIKKSERIFCLEQIQKMVYATTDEEYDQLYQSFKESVLQEVLEYFDKNWHPIRHEWVLGIKARSGSFLNNTNNRLESINSKLKQVINRHSSLEEFIHNFFIILSALRTERDHKTAIMFQKVKIYPFIEDSPELYYSQLLTSYAFSFVEKQFKLVPKVGELKLNDNIWTLKTSAGSVTVTPTNCTCLFFSSMRLPCRHILCLCDKLNIALFDSELCDKCWTSEYYKSVQRLF